MERGKERRDGGRFKKENVKLSTLSGVASPQPEDFSPQMWK